MMPPRAAIRWSLHGRHEGWGVLADQRALRFTSWACRIVEFGALVGGHPLIRREFTLYDEVAIWKQILMQTG